MAFLMTLGVVPVSFAADANLSFWQLETAAAPDEFTEPGYGLDHRPQVPVFEAGTWTFQTYGSAAFGDENGEIYTGRIGFGYYVFDGVSLSLEALGFHMNIEEGHDDEAWALGLDLILRHHILQRENWSLFAELGGGIQQSSEPVPNGGTHFNFRPMAGVGLTWQLTDDVHLLAGARWLHISNAGKDGIENNPGYDSAEIYAGIMVPF